MLKVAIIGKFFGYPKCCINWFINNRMINWKPLDEQQELVNGNKGFIPCPECAKKVTKETLSSLIKNRVCSTPFPVDKDDGLDKYLLEQLIATKL